MNTNFKLGLKIHGSEAALHITSFVIQLIVQASVSLRYLINPKNPLSHVNYTFKVVADDIYVITALKITFSV